jgi:serine/threonine protein kinase
MTEPWKLESLDELKGSPFNRSKNWKAALHAPESGAAAFEFAIAEGPGSLPELEPGKTLFIKEYLDVTLRTEAQIGEQINAAAHRLDKWNSSTQNRKASERDQGRWFKFEINKILALGNLRATQKNDAGSLHEKKDAEKPERPSVAFAFLDGPSLHDAPLEHPTSTFEILNFAYGLAIAIQKLHNQGVAHSYLAPRNLISASTPSKQEMGVPASNLSCISIVGFGYSKVPDLVAGTPGQADEEGDLYFRAPECRQPTAGSFWYPADIYSLGAILLDWILGRETARPILEGLPRDVRSLKSLIACALEEVRPPSGVEDKYLVKNQNIAKIIDSCLRFDVDERIACIEDLLDMIRTARHVDPSHHSRPTEGKKSDNTPAHPGESSEVGDAQAAVDALRGYATTRENTFQRLFSSEIATRVSHELDSLEANHIEIFGGRDRIISSLCNLLGAAKAKDKYCTLTLPDYWSDGNLGSNGRFLSMNRHAATQGVIIQRVYLVDRQFHELPESEQYILEQQVWKHVNWKVRVRVVEEDDKEIESFEENGSTVAYLQRTADSGDQTGDSQHTDTSQELHEYIALNFFSSADVTLQSGKPVVRRQIRKVRFWNPRQEADDRADKSKEEDQFAQARWTRFDQHREKFKRAFEGSVPIEEYILGPNGFDKPFKFTPEEFRKLISPPSSLTIPKQPRI